MRKRIFFKKLKKIKVNVYMIKVKNFKAFHGIMRITPRGMIVPAFELEADWLYNPDKKVWIADDVEYHEDICTVVRDDSEKHIPKKPKDREGTTYSYCPCCGSNNIYEYCGDCGQALDWSDK